MIGPELLVEKKFQQVSRAKLEQRCDYKCKQEDENGTALLFSQHSQKNEGSHRIDRYYRQVEYAAILEIVIYDKCYAYLVQPADKACNYELKYISEEVP